MKICCGNGKPYDSLTDVERLGGCNSDHCIGPVDWDKWISLQIKQEGLEKFQEWYDRMLQRGAIYEELMNAHNKLFGETN